MVDGWLRVTALGISALMTSTLSLAQISSPPITSLPDLVADRRPLGDERKFFIFHHDNTTLDEARRDLSFCLRYTQPGEGVVPPYFYNWRAGGEGKSATSGSGPYGLVGSLLGELVAGGLERSKRQINMTHCMLPRGYARYRVSEGLWKELNGRDLQASIEAQARLASGPAPPTPKVQP